MTSTSHLLYGPVEVREGSAILAAMRNKWHVELKGDLCVISSDDGKVKKEVPRSLLKQQMEPYGVVGDVFDDLCDQLDGRGRATVVAA